MVNIPKPAKAPFLKKSLLVFIILNIKIHSS